MLVISLFGKQLIGAPVAADDPRVATADARIDALNRDVSALRDQLAAVPAPSDTGAIEARVAEVGKTVDDANGRIGALEGELKSLSDKPAAPAVDPAALGALAGRIGGLEDTVRNAPTLDAIAGLDARLGQVETRAKDAALAADVAALSTKVDGVGAAVATATRPLADRLNVLDSALKARPVGDPAARQVVALGALDQALGDGRPFVAELAAVKSSSQNSELSSLDAYAAAGVPTRPALSSELSAILAALPSQKPAENASVFNRFVSNAGGLVKLTPKDGGSSAVADPRARLAALAAQGDVEQALAAREGADDAAKAATDGWAAKANARIAAEKALEGARTAALARLGATD